MPGKILLIALNIFYVLKKKIGRYIYINILFIGFIPLFYMVASNIHETGHDANWIQTCFESSKLEWVIGLSFGFSPVRYPVLLR